MATSLEELRVLQDAEKVADGIWNQVIGWDAFAREVVGGQLARAVDSIGANIAEAFGRFHYGEKFSFCTMLVAAFLKPNIGLTEQ